MITVMLSRNVKSRIRAARKLSKKLAKAESEIDVLHGCSDAVAELLNLQSMQTRMEHALVQAIFRDLDAQGVIIK